MQVWHNLAGGSDDHGGGQLPGEEFAQLISRETDRLELKTGAGAKPLHGAAAVRRGN
jgi:hypothetical protein